ncbi:MAG: twin-arginine translocase TatA/TatE family subunit [bacterium]
MVLLILESLGSTELFFILVMALIFFGPRKLPQISRMLGKNLAEFRKVSEDFKRTWEREVAMEDLYPEPPPRPKTAEENSIMTPMLAESPADEVIARQTALKAFRPSEFAAGTESTETPIESNPANTSRKHDWL